MIKIEEIAPFPVDDVRQALSGLDCDAKVIWMQEEGMNQGAF
jgi:2-oxoglutarate dehydrogenase complex dehydrogenase (E1) component-like enzyme